MAIGSDEGIDSLDFDAVEVFAGLLNHGFVGSAVDNKDQGVVVFDGLDGRLSAQGVLDDGIVVESLFLLHDLPCVLGIPLLLKSSGSPESNFGPNFLFLHNIGSLFDLRGCLFGSSSILYNK